MEKMITLIVSLSLIKGTQINECWFVEAQIDCI